jgi:hypothetical protein
MRDAASLDLVLENGPDSAAVDLRVIPGLITAWLTLVGVPVEHVGEHPVMPGGRRFGPGGGGAPPEPAAVRSEGATTLGIGSRHPP